MNASSDLTTRHAVATMESLRMAACGEADVTAPPGPPEREAESDSRWFTEEVHAHGNSLRLYLRGAFPGLRDVDDVVQESYLRIWRARKRKPIECARGFLFRVARNLALNLLKRQRISPVHAVMDLASVAVVEAEASAAAKACQEEELLLLAQAIGSLPARCREIVIMRRIHHLPQKEIAARLGISEKTVEVQVLRAIKRCEQYLRSRGVDFGP